MKNLCAVVLFICSLSAFSQIHEEFGKENSFYKLVEATKNSRVQNLIRSILENDNSMMFNGISFSTEQPICKGKSKLSLNFLADEIKCSQAIIVGECGGSSFEKVRVINEMICE